MASAQVNPRSLALSCVQHSDKDTEDVRTKPWNESSGFISLADVVLLNSADRTYGTIDAVIPQFLLVFRFLLKQAHTSRL